MTQYVLWDRSFDLCLLTKRLSSMFSIFVLMSVFHICMDWTNNFQAFLSLARTSPTFFRIISDYLIPCFLGRPLGEIALTSIVWKVSKYRVISGPYFPVLSPNTETYGPEITPYLDTSRSAGWFYIYQNKLPLAFLLPYKIIVVFYL